MALMSETERKRFLDTVRQDHQFRADVRSELLMQELLALPQIVTLLSAAVNGLIDQQAEMQRELISLRADVTSLRSDVDALVNTTRQLFEIMSNGFTEMRQGFAALRTEMQTGVADLRTETQSGVAALGTEMQAGFADLRTEMQAGFAAIDARFDRIDAARGNHKDLPDS
jgi:uncharacterized membrane-anchored protein YhcB (DUF1043 family)